MAKFGEWESIETAPKDGTAVLLLVKDEGAIQALWDGYWQYIRLDTHGCGCCGRFSDVPTHWMPLPEPPKAST